METRLIQELPALNPKADHDLRLGYPGRAYGQRVSELKDALWEIQSLKAEVARLTTLGANQEQELHQMTDNYNTLLDEVVRLGAELARERERVQKAVELLENEAYAWLRRKYSAYQINEAIALLTPDQPTTNVEEK
jgi:hypothetical protein